MRPRSGRGAGNPSSRCVPTPAYLRLALDRCLERLETDYLDVLQIDNVKMEHVRDPALWETLRAFQREGKVRAAAAFGPAIGWLYEAIELCEREPDVGAIQMICNILEQHPERRCSRPRDGMRRTARSRSE